MAFELSILRVFFIFFGTSSYGRKRESKFVYFETFFFHLFRSLFGIKSIQRVPRLRLFAFFYDPLNTCCIKVLSNHAISALISKLTFFFLSDRPLSPNNSKQFTLLRIQVYALYTGTIILITTRKPLLRYQPDHFSVHVRRVVQVFFENDGAARYSPLQLRFRWYNGE